jgi:carboxyl-terminal processing protease
LKYTIARYYTPSGRSIQAKGVDPDIEVTHSIIQEEPEDPSALLKERDLANHLEAEPNSTKKKEPPKDKSKGEEAEKEPPSRLSPLDAEQLKKDSQIRRALDSLISYELFQKLVNG